jgi:predicted ATP-dependent Lon-type protease
MRRRVKEHLKKLGGMEFYDVNFSYIDLDTFEERYVTVPEQGGGKLIPEGMCNPGQVYTVARGKSGMLGVFRLESQMLPGNGKFERTGLGTDREAKEATNTAFNFLKVNANRISGSISTVTKDYIINYQDLQGIGMTGKLAMPTLVALSSVALSKPVQSSMAILGEISISGTLIKVDELANALQVCLDSGAKKVLLPITSAADLANYKVGTQTDSAALEVMLANEAIDSFKDNISEYPTYDEAILDMEAGRIDCIVVDEVLGEYKNSKRDQKLTLCEYNFGDDFYAIGCRKEDTGVSAKINEAIATLIENGKAAEISNKWFGKNIVINEGYDK